MEVSSYRLIPVVGGVTNSHIHVYTKADVIETLKAQLRPGPGYVMPPANRVHVYADDRKVGTYTIADLSPAAPHPISYVLDLDLIEAKNRPVNRFGRRSKTYNLRQEILRVVAGVAESEFKLRSDEVEDAVDAIMRAIGDVRYLKTAEVAS